MAMSFLVFLREILSSGSFEPLLSIILMKTKFSFNMLYVILTLLRMAPYQFFLYNFFWKQKNQLQNFLAFSCNPFAPLV